MSRTTSRADHSPFLLCILLLAAFAPGVTAQPGVPPPPPRPYEPNGPEIVVAENGGEPALAGFADGGWVAAWRDPDGVTLRARLYGADDQPSGTAFVVGPAAVAAAGGPLPGQAVTPAVAALDGDRWLLAWIEADCAGACGDHLLLSLYDGTVPVFERREVTSNSAFYRLRPLLATNGADLFVVGWTKLNSGPAVLPPPDNFSDAWARIYDYDGDPASDPFRVNQEAFEEQNLHGVTYLSNGDVVFVWESYEGESFFYDVFVRRFDPFGEPRALKERVNGDTARAVSQFEPSVAPYFDGFVVTWTDWYPAPLADPEATFNGTIVGRLYAGDGTPTSGEVLISGTKPPGDRHAPAAAGSGQRMLVLWQHGCALATCDTHPDSPDGSRSGVFASSFGPRDRFNVARDLQVNRQANGDQGAPVVAALPNGFISAWASQPLAGTAAGPGPTRIVARRFGEPGCEELCLKGGRFEVEVAWKDFQGNVGRGVPVERDNDWGTFWFFRPDNVELAVKILDGRAINGHWWLFYASLTNVEYTLTLTDHFERLEPVVRSYENPSGQFGSRGDTKAVPMFEPTPSTAGSAVEPVMVVPLPVEAFQATFPHATAAAVAPLAPALAPATVAPCAAGEVCVGGDRFRIEVVWRDFFGNQGAGTGMPLTADTAWFWFFRQGNPEMLVKVLDGTPVNGRYWVFYAALTNVGFTLTVTDRVTGETATYENPLRTFASRGDTTAFDGD